MSKGKKIVEKTVVRQGDVIVIIGGGEDAHVGAKVEKEAGRFVLAYGEVTGHSHAIGAEDSAHCALYLQDAVQSAPDAMGLITAIGGGNLIADKVLEVTDIDVWLRHDEHEPVKLPPGKHVVRVQREYHPAALRNVAD